MATASEQQAGEVVEIFASSVLLAGHSSFFRALFVDGKFSDSSSKTVDIHVKLEEKESFLLLLQYIHSSKFPHLRTSEAVMSLWLIAQQFGVPSCSERCLIRLRDFPMSLPSSSYFLEKAAVVEQTEAFLHLRDDSARFLVRHFDRWEMNQLLANPPDENLLDELLSLSPASMEALISHAMFQAFDESNVVFTVLAWVRRNFVTDDERRQALERVAPWIRFPVLGTEALHVIAHQKEMRGDIGRTLVEEALWFKTCSGSEQTRLLHDIKTNIRYRRRPTPEVQSWSRYGALSSMEVWKHVKIVTEQDMKEQIGSEITFDLVDDDKALSFYMLGRTTLTQVKEEVARELGLPAEFVRLWMFVKRQNGTYRPQKRFVGIEESQSTIGRMGATTYQFFLERAPQPLSKEPRVFQPLPTIGNDEIILHFKFYDPELESISYIGRLFASKHSRPKEFKDKLLQMARLKSSDGLLLFEEIKFNPTVMCEEVEMETPLESAQLENGDILCIQKAFAPNEQMKYRHPLVKSYFDYVHRRSKNHPEGGMTR
eukprot:TRINITY_DN1352_c0_g1_i2.p1 TRINITY_DN1352_c0_g1~~TRINITY_DN1352_c0_g1_i2.p1  ORF type:complete len:542 (+),score=111.95 TRINITY_DN1352_c0_g1_i2:137-1762(+)